MLQSANIGSEYKPTTKWEEHMDTQSDVTSLLVQHHEVPEKYREKIFAITRESYQPDIRFFKLHSPAERLPNTVPEAVHLIEQSDISVGPFMETVLGAGNFFSSYHRVTEETYFALISTKMLFDEDEIPTFRLLRELDTHHLHCDGALAALFRAEYLSQHRHVEFFFQVASWPLLDRYILCMSNTYKGNFLSARSISIKSTEKPDTRWLVMFR